MANTVSALTGHYKPGDNQTRQGGEIELNLAEIKIDSLIQVAAWTDSFSDVAALIAQHTGINKAPTANKFAQNNTATVLRTEPLKWLILNHSAPELSSQQGTLLDLSHGRVHIRISGKAAQEFLNRHIPTDLREHHFKVGEIASTNSQSIDITLWRCNEGYNLFVQRSFALHFWKLLLQTAQQYNHRIVATA